MKKFIVLLLSVVMLSSTVSLFACKKEDNSLKISFYEGGFGRTWLETCANDFIAKKNAEGVNVEITLDGQGSNIDTNVDTFLTSGKNLSDIYMVRTREDWTSDVTQGFLANLNDVYESEVEKLDGSKIKIKDFLMDEVCDRAYMQKIPNQGENLPWYMPWSLLETSIIYNEDLLKATPKKGGGFWSDAPKTMQELSDLCDDINLASTNGVYGQNKSVAPISWSQAGINYFQTIIYVLWAQQQGVDESKIPNEGSFYDFWNFESSDVWKQTGIQTAIDEWRKIIVDDNTHDWKNSVANVTQKTFQESADAFCRQESVMLLGGSFFENEMGSMLDRNSDGKYDFSFKMMLVPFSDGCLQKDGHNATINYCSTDDMILVPAKASHIDLAKEFIAFMCNEKYLLDFTKETGCIRPFYYNPIELTKNDSEVVWSDFFMSCFNMMQSDYNIFTYPKKAYNDNTVSLIYRYSGPELFQGLGVVTACLKMKTMSGKQIMVEDSKDGTSVYTYADRAMKEWRINLGLDDD